MQKFVNSEQLVGNLGKLVLTESLEGGGFC